MATTSRINDDRSPSIVRVLVVEDYEPFRQFVCSILGNRPELQVICEASDGLEAVQRAEELQPDLIVLDIGLPSLNGIEAARRIRKVFPESKILFLSQESSADVAQECLSLGALGYVVKTHAGSELLSAVEAVLRGKRFLSSGLGSRGASITYRVDANKRRIHTTCVGLITFEQVIRHFWELQRDPACPDRVDVFLDLRETTSLPESGQLSAVCNEIASIRERVAFGACAIVAGGDELFGMMRLFEGLTQQYFRKISVFRVAAEAEKWLTSETVV
jgi:DNA-binding NarL/FixJ family response regulator